MNHTKLKVGDLVKVKNRSYGYFRIHAFLTKTKVELLHSSSPAFSLGVIKQCRTNDIEAVISEEPKE